MDTIPSEVAEAIKVIAGYIKKQVPSMTGNMVIFDDGTGSLYDEFGTGNEMVLHRWDVNLKEGRLIKEHNPAYRP